MKYGTSAHADSSATSTRTALSTGENLTYPISGPICSVACSCAPGTASRRAPQTSRCSRALTNSSTTTGCSAANSSGSSSGRPARPVPTRPSSHCMRCSRKKAAPTNGSATGDLPARGSVVRHFDDHRQPATRCVGHQFCVHARSRGRPRPPERGGRAGGAGRKASSRTGSDPMGDPLRRRPQRVRPDHHDSKCGCGPLLWTASSRPR